jgi:L-rhamnose isomerase/sugar isomerase
VDRKALTAYQDSNDVLMASQTLKQAYQTDVTPILQRVRLDAGGAIDPVVAYRASCYRDRVAEIRPAAGPSSGIV